MSDVRIGTAGWSIPRDYAAAFPDEGAHLERYARRMNAVEINSSFYRPHKRATYMRWAESVPDGFRFAVKVPKAITHEQRLVDPLSRFDQFLEEIAGLGDKLGPLLIQLPPSLAFDAQVATRFFSDLRRRFLGAVVCEPRHAGWFTNDAEKLLLDAKVGRVAADPAPVRGASEPGGWPAIRYYRLHGSPRIYYSAYADQVLSSVATALVRAAAAGAACWCILDNTAAFAATGDALKMRQATLMARR